MVLRIKFRTSWTISSRLFISMSPAGQTCPVALTTLEGYVRGRASPGVAVVGWAEQHPV